MVRDLYVLKKIVCGLDNLHGVQHFKTIIKIIREYHAFLHHLKYDYAAYICVDGYRNNSAWISWYRLTLFATREHIKFNLTRRTVTRTGDFMNLILVESPSRCYLHGSVYTVVSCFGVSQSGLVFRNLVWCFAMPGLVFRNRPIGLPCFSSRSAQLMAIHQQHWYYFTRLSAVR